MKLVAVYGVLALAVVLMVWTRRDVTLLRGVKLFQFNVLFVVVSAVVLWSRGRALAGAEVAFCVGLLAAPLLVRRIWFLLSNDSASTTRIIEESLGRIMARYETVDGGFRMLLRSGPVLIRSRALAAGIGVLDFHASGRPRKLDVLQKLLVKSFRPVFPRPVIRLK